MLSHGQPLPWTSYNLKQGQEMDRQNNAKEKKKKTNLRNTTGGSLKWRANLFFKPLFIFM